MNTLISFIIAVAAVVASVFTIPIVVKIFGVSPNTGFIVTMANLAAIDLSCRIIDLRGTKLEANDRLIFPRGGGSFLLAPIWVLALVMILLIVFDAFY